MPNTTFKPDTIIEFIADPPTGRKPAPAVRSAPHSGCDGGEYMLAYWLHCPCGSETYSKTPIVACPCCRWKP